jgi:hypothetical protein
MEVSDEPIGCRAHIRREFHCSSQLNDLLFTLSQWPICTPLDTLGCPVHRPLLDLFDLLRYREYWGLRQHLRLVRSCFCRLILLCSGNAALSLSPCFHPAGASANQVGRFWRFYWLHRFYPSPVYRFPCECLALSSPSAASGIECASLHHTWLSWVRFRAAAPDLDSYRHPALAAL